MGIVDDIRKEYPHPIAANTNNLDRDEYCVGGAFCLYLDNKGELMTEAASGVCFPDQLVLAYVLKDENPSLSQHEAEDFADSIIYHNDMGEFDAAWAMLDRALVWMIDAHFARI